MFFLLKLVGKFTPPGSLTVQFAPENISKPKRKGLASNPPIFRGENVSLREGLMVFYHGP